MGKTTLDKPNWKRRKERKTILYVILFSFAFAMVLIAIMWFTNKQR